ncbi:MAG: AAA family ATPase, partial [Gammaproteobacteria bacterium]|nr:AAA family ATPase [Gammaproteobacteria bacterium]
FGATAEAFDHVWQWRRNDAAETTVLCPAETAVAFKQRLQLFYDRFINDLNGPLGKVVAHWRRTEYQQRGAIHEHVVVWIEHNTEPENVINAEMPRGCRNPSPQDAEMVQVLREMVHKYQIHSCVKDRCFKSSGGKTITKCRYGFPAPLQRIEKLDETGMRYEYMRRHEEDKSVVPHNLEMMLLMDAHTNTQRVTGAFWAMYLAKYVTKLELSLNVDISEDASDVEKFLRCRITGSLEAELRVLHYPLTNGSHEVIFLTTETEPKMGILKQQKHLPKDPSSEDVFYDTKLDKYCQRPKECESIKYPEYFEQYTFTGTVRDRLEEDAIPEIQEIRSPPEIDEHQDENQEMEPQLPQNIPPDAESEGRQFFVDTKKNKVFLRRADHHALTRCKFYKATGEDQEKYFEQKVVMTQTFRSREELLQKRDEAGSWLLLAVSLDLLTDKDKSDMQASSGKGVSIENIRQMADQMEAHDEVARKEIADLLEQVEDPKFNIVAQTGAPEIEEESCQPSCISFPKPVSENLESLKDTLTESQTGILNYIEKQLDDGEQILLAITGQAGTGKSYTLDAIEMLMRQKFKLYVQRMGTTGIAAHLIGGCTVHHFFRMDADLKTKLEWGIPEQQILTRTNVLVIDEFSMLDDETLQRIDGLCRKFSLRKDKPYGNKHVILCGDPCQLPPIRTPIYTSRLFEPFKIAILKEIKRQEGGLFRETLSEIRLGIVSENGH